MSPFSPEARLVLLTALAVPTPAERSETERLVASGLNWARVEALWRHNVTGAWAHARLAEQGLLPALPEPLAVGLAETAAQVAEANAARAAIAGPLFAELAAQGKPTVILKGNVLGPKYYGALGYKRMNDVDLLMRAGDLQAFYAAYAAHGFSPVAELLDDGTQLAFSHHAPPFVHRSLRCVLGTHWGLVPPKAGFEVDYDALWARTTPYAFGGAEVLQLAPRDNLLHLCLHLPVYKTGVRELADIVNLVRGEPALDWPAFLEDVRRAKAVSKVHHALALTRALWPEPALDRAIAALAPEAGGFFARELARRLRHPEALLTMRSTLLSEIDKHYAAFELTKALPRKLAAYRAMWGLAMRAPLADVKRLNALPEETPDAVARRYRPATFARVLGHIRADLGGLVFVLVLYKQHRDLWKAWRKPAPDADPWEVLAGRLGLPPERARELKGLLA